MHQSDRTSELEQVTQPPSFLLNLHEAERNTAGGGSGCPFSYSGIGVYFRSKTERPPRHLRTSRIGRQPPYR